MIPSAAWLRLGRAGLALAVVSSIAVRELGAQDTNACDEPGEKPDVIVGEVGGASVWGRVGDIYGYSVATISYEPRMAVPRVPARSEVARAKRRGARGAVREACLS